MSGIGGSTNLLGRSGLRRGHRDEDSGRHEDLSRGMREESLDCGGTNERGGSQTWTRFIADPLFGLAYLAPSISCDAAATIVRVSIKLPHPVQNTPWTTDATRQSRAMPPVHVFLTTRHGRRRIHSHVTSLRARAAIAFESSQSLWALRLSPIKPHVCRVR